MSNRKSQIGSRGFRGGFTLLELLVVIGIILLLVGLLFPVISTVQERGREADTQATLAALTQAIERYQTASGSNRPPGPLPDRGIESDTQPLLRTVNATGVFGPGLFDGAADTGVNSGGRRITASENLYLGLMGGLVRDTAGVIRYDPREPLNSPGAASLNALQPGKLPRFYEVPGSAFRTTGGLRTGKFSDESGGQAAYDTIIPEFGDRWPDPMPIIYARAKRGVSFSGTATATNNPVITAFANGALIAPYDVAQYAPYVGSVGSNGSRVQIGVGRVRINYVPASGAPYNVTGGVAQDPHGLRTVDPSRATFDATAFFPFDAFTYFRDRSQPVGTNRAQNDESYFLFSAGRDRIYGTDDDLTAAGRLR